MTSVAARLHSPLLAAALLAAVLWSQTAFPAQTGEVLAGLDGGERVTVDDLRAEVERIRSADPGRHLGEADVERVFRRLVETRLLAAAARREEFDRSPEMQRDIARLLAARYQEKSLEPRLRALATSDDELLSYWRGHQNEFARPEQVRGAVVSVLVSPKDPPEARAAARDRAAEARRVALRDLKPETRDFGAVAVAYSDDQATRYRGGDTGWLSVGEASRWGAEVSAALGALKQPGEISPVIETPRGFLLVRLAERKPSAMVPLEEVREAIRRKVMAAKRDELVRGFYAEMGSRGGLSVDENRVTEAVRRLAGAAERGSPPPLPSR